MTSLFMGSVVTSGVPADEKVIRNTATPYVRDAPAAMQEDMPEAQELETDPNPDLGMAPRQMASKWVDGVSAVPQIDTVNGQNISNQMINQQVSTSGSAAAREASGQTHKNLSYAVGIEPVFDLGDPNHKFGNTYFVREERDIQEGAGDYMSAPPGYDHSLQGNISAAGKQRARQASQSSMYDSWWNEGR
jgi:hypothetical protein